MRFRTYLPVVAAWGLSAAFAQGAAVIVQPSSVTDNSSFGGSPSSLTIDGSNFTAPNQAIIANGQPVPGTWPSSTGGFAGNWVSTSQGAANTPSTSATVAVTYTLSGSPVNIASMHYWWYDGDQAGRDLSQFSLSFSADGTTFSTPQVFSALPKETADNQPNAGTDLVLAAPATGVKFARISNMTNYGTPDTFGSFFGIEEVRFVTAVPEPTSLALLAPLGLLAMRGRRRSA